MLSAKRDIAAAKRFFKKKMRADHRRLPYSISVDQHASDADAFAASQAEEEVPRLPLAPHQILKQRDRAGPPRGKKEVAGDAMLPHV